MRNPSQVLLLAILMASLILPPGLPLAGAASQAPIRERSILLVGDSLSVGLGKQLETVFAGRPGLHFAHLGKVSSGLANPAFFDWNAHLTALVRANHPDLVLIMVGANDDKPLPGADGHSAAFGTKAWDAAYAARLTRLHSIVRAENPRAAVYFIGVPVMGDAAFNAEMTHVNHVLAVTAAALPDSAFIDVKDTLADAHGRFAPLARTADGGVVKLRAADGVHITGTGSRLLAARCLDAVSADAGLPEAELLAAVADRDAKPVSGAAETPVRLAEAPAAARPATPVAKPALPAVSPAKVVAAAKTTPAAPVVVAQAPVASRPVTVKAAPVTAPAPAATPAAAYTVADGDTLWAVAKRLGVSADTLAAANPGVDPRRMSIGQELALPDGATLPAATASDERTAPAEQAAAGVHVVAEGDNFWNVAKRHNISVAALTQANPGVDPTRLRIGQELALPGAGDAPVAVAAGDTGHYVVADGDNLWAIAHRLGIDVERLTRANVAVNPLKLQPGQVLTLPGTAQAAGGRTKPAGHSASQAALYPVAPGDTLWALARRFGVDFATLLAVNGDVDPSHLRVGQLVTIPSGGPMAEADALSFPVSAGDTLWSVARRFDVSVEALVAANPGVDPLRLREGQTLRVPSSLAAVAATAAPKAEPAAASVPTPAVARPADAEAPAPAALATPVRVHTVSEGDTVWDLARRYGVSVAAILSQNAGLDPVRLHVGQAVRLPGSAVAMAAR